MKRILRIFLVISAMAGIHAALAADVLDAAVKLDDRLLPILDNSFWIADGNLPSKQIYVIAAPWCGVCQRLYQMITADNRKRVQFRWVEMGGNDATSNRQVAEAGVLRDVSLLKHMYVTVDPPNIADADAIEIVTRYQKAVAQTLRAAAKTTPLKDWGFPTLLWLSPKGLVAGNAPQNPSDLNKLIDTVVPRPEAAAINPASSRILKARNQWEPGPAAGNYTPIGDSVELFLFPDASLPAVEVLTRGHFYKAWRRSITLDGVRWIELKVYTDYPEGLFVRESEVKTVIIK